MKSAVLAGPRREIRIRSAAPAKDGTSRVKQAASQKARMTMCPLNQEMDRDSGFDVRLGRLAPRQPYGFKPSACSTHHGPRPASLPGIHAYPADAGNTVAADFADQFVSRCGGSRARCQARSR